MKFTYYNDTNRIVNIHPATFSHGCTGEINPIKPLEERTFVLPEGTYPWVKMWDFGEGGLSLLISPTVEEMEKDKDADDPWNQILDLISMQVSRPAYESWFKPTKAQITEKSLIVYCKNEFQRDWLETTYQDLITSAAKKATGKELQVSLVNEDED